MNRSRIRHSNPYWGFTAVFTAIAVLLLSGINVALMDTGLGNLREFTLGLALGTTVLLIATLLVGLAVFSVRNIPGLAIVAISGALLTLYLLYTNNPGEIARLLLDGTPNLEFSPDVLSVPVLTLLVLALGSSVGLLSLKLTDSLPSLHLGHRLLAYVATFILLAGALITVFRLVSDGADPYPDDGAAPEIGIVTALPTDPGADGPYSVATLTYAAGPNPRRPDYQASNRDLESRTVDARKLLPEWRGFKQDKREEYWGYGIENAPLNGQVWEPEGPGPFPLVLIVHGNHGMEDYSDGGYAYLGELLASRGFITVSVDQNYINGSWSGDFRGREMAARAWLLLEHLALWRDWNSTPEHRFASRVDLDNIALIGHSRGGEAVSIARRFNSLPHFPDDATQRFDYGFNIRALVAIAQVDQRYQRRVELEDVNFFTIHGSYDSDEPAYHGLRQMNRISLSGDTQQIKAGVYLHGANHGQFNTGWGRYDYSPPGAWRLNTAAIIPGEEQRQVAKVYISAFLEATLHGRLDYLPALKDPRRVAAFLPPRTLVHQFTDSSFLPLASFEEDINTITASESGATITTRNLAIWREEQLQHRDERLQGSNAVVLGWRTPDAQWRIDADRFTQVGLDRALSFGVSGSLEKLPDPEAAELSDKTAAIDDTGPPAIPDFSIQISDASGQRASLQASGFAQLIPPVRVQYLKNKVRNKEAYNAIWEPVLQHVEIPFAAFAALNPALDLNAIREISFNFDQTDEGVLILDNIGTLQLRTVAPAETLDAGFDIDAGSGTEAVAAPDPAAGTPEEPEEPGESAASQESEASAESETAEDSEASDVSETSQESQTSVESETAEDSGASEVSETSQESEASAEAVAPEKSEASAESEEEAAASDGDNNPTPALSAASDPYKAAQEDAPQQR